MSKKKDELLSIELETKADREGIISLLQTTTETMKFQNHDTKFRLSLRLKERPKETTT